MTFENVVSGSKVWIEGRSVGKMVRYWRIVLRVTRTQIVLAECLRNRFRRVDGVEIGGLTHRIVALATDEQIAAYEIEHAARVQREEVLKSEERQLRRELQGYAWDLERRGNRYVVRATCSAAEMRAMFAAMKGVRA